MSDSEFSYEKQKLLIEHMLTNEHVFQRAANILKSKYFDSKLSSAVQCMLEHANNFNALPSPKQIFAETNINLEKLDNVRIQDDDWALDSIEKFCKRQAIVHAVWDAPEHIEKGNYGQVEALVKAATEVSLQKDLGINYFENPKERLERMKVATLYPTGWRDIDRKLYGGLNRGEITIFCGASGAGKSLFLQNIALNWVYGTKYEFGGKEETYKPMNVVYISLELSEELISKRVDTMVTGIDAREIFKRIDEVQSKVILTGKKSGKLRIKQMLQGTTTADIRAYLKEYEIQTGIKVDALCVDYLDLMHPGSVKVSASDMFVKDKYVTEELRGLAAELNILCATASQLNRSAIDEADHSQNMIAGGISKINTADNVLSIFSSPAMRERGEYQAQFLKTRSSAGVGSKVHLSFNTTTLRIGNMEEGYQTIDNEPSLRDTVSSSSSVGNATILNKIKRKPEVDNNVDSDNTVDNDTTSPVENLNLSLNERLKKLKQENKLS